MSSGLPAPARGRSDDGVSLARSEGEGSVVDDISEKAVDFGASLGPRAVSVQASVTVEKAIGILASSLDVGQQGSSRCILGIVAERAASAKDATCAPRPFLRSRFGAVAERAAKAKEAPQAIAELDLSAFTTWRCAT